MFQNPRLLFLVIPGINDDVAEGIPRVEIPGGIPGTNPTTPTADHPVLAFAARSLESIGLVAELLQNRVSMIVP
jgi:hypothetical protein